MTAISQAFSTVLGAPNIHAFPKVQYAKIKEIIDRINSIATASGAISGSTLAVSGATVLTGSLATGVVTEKHTAAAINITATATPAQIATGYITSTSAAAVGITLPTATDLGTALGAAAGTSFEFIVDNTAGANTVTVIVGAGITAATPVITGGGTLTVSVANAIGIFRVVFSSATVAKLYRIG